VEYSMVTEYSTKCNFFLDTSSANPDDYSLSGTLTSNAIWSYTDSIFGDVYERSAQQPLNWYVLLPKQITVATSITNTIADTCPAVASASAACNGQPCVLNPATGALQCQCTSCWIGTQCQTLTPPNLGLPV